MHPQYFILWPKQPRETRIAAIFKFISGLALERGWEIIVKPQQKKRSHSQNNYLWGVVYPTILKSGHKHLEGWTDKDLHDYFLELHFGTEVLHFNGRDHERALKRSSKLSTLEFMDYIGRIQQEMAQLGIFIPDPDPEWYLHQERAA
jgi:hypothetical protein